MIQLNCIKFTELVENIKMKLVDLNLGSISQKKQQLPEPLPNSMSEETKALLPTKEIKY